MKILLSCLSRSWGGLEMYALISLLAMRKQNIEVDLLCHQNSKLHKEALKNSVNVIPLKAKSYFHPVEIYRLKNIIGRSHYDLVHTHASKDLWLIVPALQLVKKQIPLVLTKHVGSYIVKKDLLHKWLYSRVTMAIAISQVIQKNLIDTTPIHIEKIKIVYDGIDISKYNPQNAKRESIRNEFSISDDEIVIGMTARFSPGKGHLEFIGAALALNNQFTNLKFLIVGEASFKEDAYALGIIQQGKEIRNIIFTGFRVDIPDILSAMDIFVFPSHAEAFGMALVEAMAMEKASVASDSDGVLDIILDDKTGLLFQNKNVDDLVRKISSLIADNNKREALGKAAREQVIGSFNLDKVTSETISIYRDLGLH